MFIFVYCLFKKNFQHGICSKTNCMFSTMACPAICGGLSQWETHDNPTPLIITFDDLKYYLATEWNSFHFSGNKLH